jgi:hypothetical protein
MPVFQGKVRGKDLVGAAVVKPFVKGTMGIVALL